MRVAPQGTRWCSRCEQFVAHADYSRNVGGPGGFGSACKACKAAIGRELKVIQQSRPDLTAAARFWPKVNKDAPNGCWLWTASAGKDGYGRFAYRGVVLNAHRVSMILHLGSVPDDMDVDHCGCRNRLCVNPAHLRLATQRESAIENNDAPHAKNAQKTHCVRGHEFTPENTRRYFIKNRKSRHGTPMAGSYTRICLACYRLKHQGPKRRGGDTRAERT